jgi:FG-GAP repeat
MRHAKTHYKAYCYAERRLSPSSATIHVFFIGQLLMRPFTSAFLFSFGLLVANTILAATIVNTIPGTRGFKVSGALTGDGLGGLISGIGDINGDGFADMAISATGTDRVGATNVGAVYVIFGKASATTDINVTSLDGSNGFKLTGNLLTANSALGTDISPAGDVNGDGRKDFIVASSAGFFANSGKAYVVFGAASFAATLDVSGLNGSNGFGLIGDNVLDYFGTSVAGGSDLNSDGIDDIVVGAPGSAVTAALGGRAFIFFGRSTWTATVAASTNSFAVAPTGASDQLGSTVAMGGDVNNDGREDLLLGSIGTPATGASGAGNATIIFGRPIGTPFPATISATSLDGSSASGFRVRGIAANDGLGVPAAFVGDVNGDNVGDILMGAASSAATATGAGQSCVLFGKGSGFSAEINPASFTGSDGFCLNGEGANDSSGETLVGVGDMNGDNINDFLLGASNGDAPGLLNSGKIYLVHGSNAVRNPSYNLSTLGTVTLPGEVFTGYAASQFMAGVAGIGKFSNAAPSAYALGVATANSNAGEVYVVTGSGGPIDQVFRNGFE